MDKLHKRTIIFCSLSRKHVKVAKAMFLYDAARVQGDVVI